MTKNYIAEYRSLLKGTLMGVKVRAFIFGYGSKRLEKYLSGQKQRIWTLQDEAHREGWKIQTKRNAELGSKLFRLEVKVLFSET